MLKENEVYGFVIKMRELILMQILRAIILNVSSIRSKLLGNTVAQPAPNAANGIIKNVTIAMSLKYNIK